MSSLCGLRYAACLLTKRFGTSGRAESLRSLIEKIWGGQSGRYLAEARKLEHHYPHALKVKYNGS